MHFMLWWRFLHRTLPKLVSLRDPDRAGKGRGSTALASFRPLISSTRKPYNVLKSVFGLRQVPEPRVVTLNRFCLGSELLTLFEELQEGLAHRPSRVSICNRQSSYSKFLRIGNITNFQFIKSPIKLLLRPLLVSFTLPRQLNFCFPARSKKRYLSGSGLPSSKYLVIVSLVHFS